MERKQITKEFAKKVAKYSKNNNYKATMEKFKIHRGLVYLCRAMSGEAKVTVAYTVPFKKKVSAFAKKKSRAEAAKKYNVNSKTVDIWMNTPWLDSK